MSTVNLDLRDSRGRVVSHLSRSKGFSIKYGRKRVSAYWLWPTDWNVSDKNGFLRKAMFEAELFLGGFDESEIFTKEIMYQTDFFIFPKLEYIYWVEVPYAEKNKRYPEYSDYNKLYYLHDIIPPNSRYIKDVSERTAFSRIQGLFGGEPITIQNLNFTLKDGILVNEDNIEDSLEFIREVFVAHVYQRFNQFVGKGFMHRLRVRFEMLRDVSLKNPDFDVDMAEYSDGISLEREVLNTYEHLEEHFFELTTEFMDEDKKFEEYFKHALGGMLKITGFNFETVVDW